MMMRFSRVRLEKIIAEADAWTLPEGSHELPELQPVETTPVGGEWQIGAERL